MQNTTARLTLTLLIGACVALVGCESDDDGGDVSAQSTGSSVANVAGNWQFTATHDGGTGTGTLTIQQNGSALTAQTPLGTYSGSVNGSIVTLRGPGEEVDEMEWVMTLNDINNPTQMSVGPQIVRRPVRCTKWVRRFIGAG